MVATVPVQHRTLPEEGYDAALHIVVCKGSGHGICIHMHSSKLITCVCYLSMKIYCSWNALEGIDFP